MAKTKDVQFILTFNDKGTATLRKAIGGSQKEFSKFAKSAKTSEAALKGVSKQSTTSSKGIGKLKGMLSSTWGQMAMGMGVMTGVTGAFRMISRAITSTIQIGRDFEREWANTVTMMGSTTSGAVEYKNALLAMSPVLGSSIELTKGLYQVLSASIPEGAKAFEFLTVASRSAQAGITDIATSVDALTTVYNAYGAETYKVNEISDIMFQTVKRGKLTYESLAGAIGTVVPIASQVGVRFEEIAGAMATLTRQGIDVNTATVSLRQTLVSVLKPTTDASAMAKRLGLEFTSSAIRAKGLSGFLVDVKEKTKGNVESLTALFGNIRALTGVFALAGSQIHEFTGDVELMNQAVKDGTATNEALKKQMQTMDFWIKTVGVVLEKFKIQLWQGLIEPFQEGIMSTEDMAQKLEDFQKKVLEVGKSIGNAIGNTIKFIHDHRKAIVLVAKAYLAWWILIKKMHFGQLFLTAASSVGVFTSALKKGYGATASLKLATIGATGKIKALGLVGKKALLALTSPLGIIIAGLAVMTLAIKDGINSVKKLNTTVSEFENVTNKKLSGVEKFWLKLNAATAKYTGAMPYAALATKYYAEETVKATAEQIEHSKKTLESIKTLGTFKSTLLSVVDTYKSLTGVVTDMWVKADPTEALNRQGKAFTELYNSGTASFEMLKKGIDDLTGAYLKAGIDMPAELQKIGLEIDAQGEKIKQAAVEWQKFVQGFKKGIPTMADLTKNTKGISQAIKELTANEADSVKVMGLFKDTIDKLYKEGLLFQKLYGKDMPASLIVLKQKLDAAADSVTQVGKGIENMDDIMKLVPANIKNIEYGFWGITASGEKVFKSLTKITGIANKMGVTFKSEFKKSLTAYEKDFAELMTNKGDIFLEKQLEMVQKIISGYERLSEEVPEFYKDMLKDLLEQTKKTGSTILENIGGALTGLGRLLSPLASEIGGFAGDLIGTFGGLVETIGNSWESITEDGSINFKKLAAAATQMAGQVGAAIGGAISGIEDNFGDLGASIGSTIGGILGPVGSAIGGLLGGVIGGLFGKAEDAAARVARLAEEHLANLAENMKTVLSEFGEISDALAESIAQDALEMEGFAAVSKNFGEVIREVGVSQENINGLWERATDIIHQTAQGFLTAEDGAAALNSSFEQLLVGAQNFGTEGSAAMVEFINKVKQSGLEVAAVTDYINEQLGVTTESSMNAAQGLEAMAAQVGNSEAAMLRLENQTLAVYNAMIANGATASQAMNALGGTLDAIAAKHKDMGTEASAAIQELLGIREVIKENEKLFSAIEGNLAVMNALANTGSLTQQTLNDSADAAKRYYNQLESAGLTGNQALAQMVPTLERLAFLAEQHGLEIDNNTQAMIDQAREQGLMGEAQLSMQDTMMAGFGLLLEALGHEIPAAMQHSIDAMNDLEHSMHGSGVTGALDEINLRSSATFGAMHDDAMALVGDFNNMAGSVNNIQDQIDGLHAPDLTFKIDGDFSALEDQWKNYDPGSTPSPASGRKGKATYAQGGYHGTVVEREQRFVAHRGEEVRITPAGEKSEISVQISPVVIPRNDGSHIIEFVVKKIEGGDVKIPMSSVRD